MQEKRNFTLAFKRQVAEELLSGVSRPAQLCRRHNIAVSLLYHWKKQYGLGKLNNEPVKEAAMSDKIEKLERMVGKLAMENEFLKKALQNNISRHNGKEISSGPIINRSKVQQRDAA
jgi:transposase-like protein